MNDTNDPDVANGIIGRLCSLRQIGNEAADMGRRHGRNHSVCSKHAAAGSHAGYAALARRYFLDWRRQMDAPALFFDGGDERRNQRLRTAVDIAKFLLEHRSARSADPFDTGGDPGRRNIVGILVEFQVEQPPPQKVEHFAAGTTLDPLPRRNSLQIVEAPAPGRQKHLQAGAEFRDRTKLRKEQ